MRQIVLASSSPRRREILGYLGKPFVVRAAEVDETVREGEAPQAMVLRLSREKATAVAESLDLREALVLGADTTVVIDGTIIGKPTDAADAEAILKRLRGRTHQVFTGLYLVRATPGGEPWQWSAVCETQVSMRAYRDDELWATIAGGEVYDKAGAYAIQDAVFHPVERIAGCYLNVMGLPLCEVIRGLRESGELVEAEEPVRHDCLGERGEPCGR